MGTNNNNQSLQEQIDKLAHELDKERNTINQLRSSIDVLHAGWTLDKDKLTEAVDKLNEKDEKVIKIEGEDIKEFETSPKESKCSKKRMTTRSLSSKKRHKGDTSSTDDKSLRKSTNVLLSCPLCCNKSFATQEALKCHLRSVFNNVVCPVCSQICENVTTLINHLEVGCEGSQINAVELSSTGNVFTLSQNTLAIVSFKNPGYNVDKSSFDGLQIVGESKEIKPKAISNKIKTAKTKTDQSHQIPDKKIGINYQKKGSSLTEACFDSDVEDVTEQRAVINLSDDESETNNDDGDDESETNNDDGNDDEYDMEDDEYLCSACNMSFTSIIDHIKQYHFGEEVKIEGAPDELKKKLLTCGKVISDGEGTDCTLQQTQNVSEDNNQPIERENTHDCNGKGYWTKRGSYYNFVKKEDKMKLLYPSFVPSKSKVATTYGSGNKKYRSKILFEKLDLIQVVDDKSLLGGAHQSLIAIYVVDENKAKDKKKLGPVAKLIPILHRSKIKIESNDDFEECNSKSGTNKMSDQQRLRSSQYIQVLKVLLGKDKEITIENVNFDMLPPVPENIVPYLANVTNPEIPLLKGAKQLKWQCSLCLSPVSSVFVASRSHNCYKCKYCGKGFRKNISVFMKHLLDCGKTKANAAKPFACSCCPSFFKTIEEARNHMPLHYPGSRAVQCSLCYCLLSNKTVLNAHLKSEHNTDISQIGSEVRQPRLKAKTKYRLDSPSKYSPTTPDSDINNKYQFKSNRRSNKTQAFSEVQIKEEKDEESTPSRSSRKRKMNKTYFDECYVY